ncbi:NACHT domain-containing protein [Actinomadura rubteroloni]|nr:NACHT domain-containing protein [Actinomadura rubteroloni]
MPQDESSFEFEARALNIARAIHDPAGLQGPVFYQGRERDAIFVTSDAIHAYEFTTRRDVEKAKHDAQKTKDMLTELQRKPENAFKSLTGWFVTREEPTADQKKVIAQMLRGSQVVIHPISVTTLLGRLCNSEAYLAARGKAPFGSIAYSIRQNFPDVKVPVPFFAKQGGLLHVGDVSERLAAGSRFLLSGEFGIGKSHALREIYLSLRKAHLRSHKLKRFPLHINLRDCVGLRSPAEIIRRHAEEIGFPEGDKLISAWRAGSCTLLLDGFDEVVPPRWLGSASDLKDFRWEALAPVRRLIEETPTNSGVITCGRSHYFSSEKEMLDALGFGLTCNLLTLNDFDKEQLQKYLDLVGVQWSVPDWMPTRPLLIGYLVSMQLFSEIDSTLGNPTTAWRKLFSAVCERESRMFVAVRPQVIQRLVSRVATIARSNGDETGPVDVSMLRTAFIDVNGREPDEEGSQVLLRLPGLAIADAETNSALDGEKRYFVDKSLAETAYGEDLAQYLISPYDSHALSRSASWVQAASELGIGVATAACVDAGVTATGVIAAAKRRQNNHQYDAVLADALRVHFELGPGKGNTREQFLIEGVIFPFLTLSGDDPIQSRTTFSDCVIETLDVSDVDAGEKVPIFRNTIIGYLEGASRIPDWLNKNLTSCEIYNFSAPNRTTAAIMELKISPERRVALAILKKIYAQPGSGRKEGALFRGMDMRSRELVPDVIGKLVSGGWISPAPAGREHLYVQVKGIRGRVMRALDDPASFYF